MVGDASSLRCDLLGWRCELRVQPPPSPEVRDPGVAAFLVSGVSSDRRGLPCRRGELRTMGRPPRLVLRIELGEPRRPHRCERPARASGIASARDVDVQLVLEIRCSC
jgi:hypothetical protein